MLSAVVVIALELGARGVLAWRRANPLAIVGFAPSLDLDPYEIPDPRLASNWILKPGYEATSAQLLKDKEASGRTLTVERLRREMQHKDAASEALAIRINAQGFRGPGMDSSRGKLRILTLGDSCTFGSTPEDTPYPRAMERALRARGLDVEVVNGGVEGYSPANILARIADFTALQPQVTTIYIGWNVLFGVDQSPAILQLGKAAWRRVRTLIAGPGAVATSDLNKTRRPDLGAAQVRAAAGYVPACMPQLEQIVDRMAAAGSRVVLVTLPGLFTMRAPPSERALAIGHLPESTDNPYVLAKLAERYNLALRKLALRRGLLLIDLDAWADRELQPRDEHFVDAVHLDASSQGRVGEHLAERLAPLVDVLLRKAGSAEAAPP